MIDMHSNYVNINKHGIFYALICINKNIISYIHCMLSVNYFQGLTINAMPTGGTRSTKSQSQAHAKFAALDVISEIQRQEINFAIGESWSDTWRIVDTPVKIK